jgi:hypothetical protein
VKSKARTPGLRAKFILLSGSVFFCFLCLFAAEGLCRLFCLARFQGSSRNLFIARAYGESKGNTPNVEALSFGTTIFTDSHGFRVPPGDDRESAADSPALLILGDSVGFGAGVEEAATFAGRLRTALPGTVIHNSSVVGYNTHDYEAVVEHFCPRTTRVRGVVLVLCLNDLGAASARNIDTALDRVAENRDAVSKAKELPVVRQLNEYLRSRSKLFLTLKIVLTDPQARYWATDARLYDDGASGFDDNIRPIAAIAALLETRGLPFVVVISPYEYQLRDGVEGAEVPQRKLTDFFNAAGIDHVDALPRFREAGKSSRELYLPGDPMHLSEKGHRVIAAIIQDILAEWESRGTWLSRADVVRSG